MYGDIFIKMLVEILYLSAIVYEEKRFNAYLNNDDNTVIINKFTISRASNAF